MGQCCSISELSTIQPSAPKQAWPEMNFNNENKKISLESINKNSNSISDEDEMLDKCTTLTPQSSSTHDLTKIINGISTTNSSSRKESEDKLLNVRGESRTSITSVASVGSMIRRNSIVARESKHEKVVIAEDILSNVLKMIHKIIAKQADSEKIDQKELLSLIIYLQKPRKLVARMTTQKMMKEEAKHRLDGLQSQDSAVSSWISNVMNVRNNENEQNNNNSTKKKNINIVLPATPNTNTNRRQSQLLIGQTIKRSFSFMVNGISSISSSMRLTKMFKMIDTNKELKQCFNNIEKWQFNAFQLLEITNRPLTILGLYAMNLFDLFNKFHIEQNVFLSFIEKIEDLYNDNPYHNSAHAADVLAAELFWLINSEDIHSKLESIDFLTCIIGAAIHDVAHPGTTSDFEIRTSSDIAIQYNDTSVLENYHLSVSFNILKKQKYNIFAKFSSQIRTETRKALIEMVLTTDISKHLEHVALIKDYLLQQEIISMINEEDINPNKDDMDQNTFNNLQLKTSKNSKYKNYRMSVNDENEINTQSFMTRSEIRALLRNISIKVSDLSNPTRPLHIALLWTDRIIKEFMNQGDKERELGLTVTPTMDRNNSNIELSQLAFIDHIIIPLYESWFQLSNITMIPLQNLIIVRNYWIQKVEAKTNKEQTVLRKKNNQLKLLFN